MRLFDPSFGGKEFWEGDTMDNGNDPMGLITRQAPCSLRLAALRARPKRRVPLAASEQCVRLHQHRLQPGLLQHRSGEADGLEVQAGGSGGWRGHLRPAV